MMIITPSTRLSPRYKRRQACSPGEAFQITYAAHNNGQAVAYVGDRPQCEQVAKVLREIDLHVELEEA